MKRMVLRAFVLAIGVAGLLASRPAAACHTCGHGVPGGMPGPCQISYPTLVPQTVTTYKTVCETVVDKVPVTVMKTRVRKERVPYEVPVTRCVCEEVPYTKMVTRKVKVTDWVPARGGCCTHGRPMGHCCNQPRMVPVTRCVRECVPVTKTHKKLVKVTEMVTKYRTVCVPEEVPVTITRCVPRQVTRTIPVTHTVMVPAAPAPVAYAPAAAPQAMPTGQAAPAPQAAPQG